MLHGSFVAICEKAVSCSMARKSKPPSPSALPKYLRVRRQKAFSSGLTLPFIGSRTQDVTVSLLQKSRCGSNHAHYPRHGVGGPLQTVAARNGRREARCGNHCAECRSFLLHRHHPGGKP